MDSVHKLQPFSRERRAEAVVTLTCCSPFVQALSYEAGAGQFMTDFFPLTAWYQVPPVSLSVSLCA